MRKMILILIAAVAVTAFAVKSGDVVQVGDFKYVLMNEGDVQTLLDALNEVRLQWAVVQTYETNKTLKTAFELRREIMKTRRRIALDHTNTVTVTKEVK